MDKIFNWIDKNKNKDSAIINLLKLLYSISASWVQAVLDIILSLFLGTFYENNNIVAFIIILLVIIIVSIWFWIVSKYSNFRKEVNRNLELILNEVSTALGMLDEYVDRRDYEIGKGLFEYASEVATNSMYDVLKKITGVEVRVSVIQQFHEYKSRRKCMMISRRSKNRKVCSKETIAVQYTGKNNYYYLKILKDNVESYTLLENQTEIEKKFYHKSKVKKSNIHQYIGLAQTIKTEDVAFLLQIDGMEKDSFGKNKDEINIFIDNYIDPYIQFLKHAYNMERSFRKGDSDE